MSFEEMLSMTVTVKNAEGSTSDRYSNPVKTPESTGTDYPAWIEQNSSSENLNDRDTTIGQWLLVLPKDAVIFADSIVEYLGQTFRVSGEPAEKRTPFEGLHHIECQLQEIQGG